MEQTALHFRIWPDISTRFSEPSPQWREANLQIAEHAASQARLQRDQDIESFVSTETLTAYRVAKTLKMTAPAVAQIRKRLASTTQED